MENSLSFWASMLWNKLLDQYKPAESNNEFKIKIKSWTGFGCNCHICSQIQLILLYICKSDREGNAFISICYIPSQL